MEVLLICIAKTTRNRPLLTAGYVILKFEMQVQLKNSYTQLTLFGLRIRNTCIKIGQKLGRLRSCLLWSYSVFSLHSLWETPDILTYIVPRKYNEHACHKNLDNSSRRLAVTSEQSGGWTGETDKLHLNNTLSRY